MLLFGLDEPQTYQGFNALFAHLARVTKPGGSTPEWLSRLTLVQGKAPYASEARAAFGERCRQIAAEVGLIGSGTVPDSPAVPAEPFGDVPWDEEVADDSLFMESDEILGTTAHVLDDGNFRGFDPFARHDLLSEKIYSATFGSLLSLIRAGLASEAVPESFDFQAESRC